MIYETQSNHVFTIPELVSLVKVLPDAGSTMKDSHALSLPTDTGEKIPKKLRKICFGEPKKFAWVFDGSVVLTSPTQTLNTALLTREESEMPMGLGVIAAADRLGLIYLADQRQIAHLLCSFADEVLRLESGKKMGLLNVAHYDNALEEMIDRLTTILRGENPRYMAIEWFTDPNQFARMIEATHRKFYEDDAEASARLKADPIREEALIFLTSLAEHGILDGDTDFTQFISGYVRHFLGLPEGIPMTLEFKSRERKFIEVSPQRVS